MKSAKIRKNEKSRIWAILLVLLSLLFAFPSIIYIKNRGTLFLFDKECTFLLNEISSVYQTMAYLGILSVMIFVYYFVIKKRNQIFANITSTYIYIGIVSAIFIVVVPFLSSDIFYYLGIGRLQSEYHQNPYYVTMQEYVNDFEKGVEGFESDTAFLGGYFNVWAGTTVVYGPVWTLLCRIFASFSGNIDVGIFAFKFANLVVHLLNCVLIYKLSRKKLFVLLYGLNPFVLIEGIAEGHNDVYMLLFTLSAIYAITKHKKIWISLIFLSLATNIKFVMILVLPFIVLYHLRNKKWGERLLGCIFYGFAFLFFLSLPYLFYYQDRHVFLCMFVQRERIARGLYHYIFYCFFNGQNEQKIYFLSNIATILFVVWYGYKCVKLLVCKQIKWSDEMRTCMGVMFVFIMFLLTNCQMWYLIWLFAFLIWQKSNVIKAVVRNANFDTAC